MLRIYAAEALAKNFSNLRLSSFVLYAALNDRMRVVRFFLVDDAILL